MNNSNNDGDEWRGEEDNNREEEEEEYGNRKGMLGPGGEREKWMHGLKTPNMRTLKALKSPSEKEYPFLNVIYVFFFDSFNIICYFSQPII